MTAEITFFMAFIAGLLSFLSPCVLPLIPSYLGILGGMSHGKPVRTSIGFILGFSVVFIALGFFVNTAFYLFSGIASYINIASGIIVVVLGVNVIFDFIPFLNYEKRPFLKNNNPAAFIAGAAFGAGWTPCIGPILTGILLMAGRSGETINAIICLSLYSLGFGIPFFLFAVFFDFFSQHSKRINKHPVLIKRISGALLIIIGIIIFTGKYSALNGQIQIFVNNFINLFTMN